jgi:hypothetical protein
MEPAHRCGDGGGVADVQPHVFAVTPLVQGLVDRLTSLDASDGLLEPRRVRLVGVLVDELAAGERPSLHLPMPQDKRLVAMAAALADDPALADGIDRMGRSHRHGAPHAHAPLCCRDGPELRAMAAAGAFAEGGRAAEPCASP